MNILITFHSLFLISETKGELQEQKDGKCTLLIPRKRCSLKKYNARLSKPMSVMCLAFHWSISLLNSLSPDEDTYQLFIISSASIVFTTISSVLQL